MNKGLHLITYLWICSLINEFDSVVFFYLAFLHLVHICFPSFCFFFQWERREWERMCQDSTVCALCAQGLIRWLWFYLFYKRVLHVLHVMMQLGGRAKSSVVFDCVCAKNVCVIQSAPLWYTPEVFTAHPTAFVAGQRTNKHDRKCSLRHTARGARCCCVACLCRGNKECRNQMNPTAREWIAFV